MAETVGVLGIVCVIAAIGGGGLKARGVAVPIIDSLWRQGLLAAFGIVLLLISNAIYLVERD